MLPGKPRGQGRQIEDIKIAEETRRRHQKVESITQMGNKGSMTEIEQGDKKGTALQTNLKFFSAPNEFAFSDKHLV